MIHERYRARLSAYVRHQLSGRSAEDVEDAVQDVFERAARTLRAGGAPIGLRAWLYGVAHNRCVDELRRRAPAPPDVFDMSRVPSSDTAAVVERRAELDRLVKDLRALPELQRSALLMREMQGLSHAELAETLDVSVPAVKSVLVRARVGLASAEEAREVPCERIRSELASAHGRRVKADAKSARHLRECDACCSYRAELRSKRRRLGAVFPFPFLLPLGRLMRIVGGSGLHAAGGPVATTSVIGSGGVVFAGASKLATVLSVATLVGTGAALEHKGSLGVPMPWSASVAAHRTFVAGHLPRRVADGAAARALVGVRPTSSSPPLAGAPVDPAIGLGVAQAPAGVAPAVTTPPLPAAVSDSASMPVTSPSSPASQPQQPVLAQPPSAGGPPASGAALTPPPASAAAMSQPGPAGPQPASSAASASPPGGGSPAPTAPAATSGAADPASGAPTPTAATASGAAPASGAAAPAVDGATASVHSAPPVPSGAAAKAPGTVAGVAPAGTTA